MKYGKMGMKESGSLQEVHIIILQKIKLDYKLITNILCIDLDPTDKKFKLVHMTIGRNQKNGL